MEKYKRKFTEAKNERFKVKIESLGIEIDFRQDVTNESSRKVVTYIPALTAGSYGFNPSFTYLAFTDFKKRNSLGGTGRGRTTKKCS